ncbi:MAG: DUF2914 domain-containing protein [Gammaproteobacteria bacterium]|nr:DUF2914 domain-containing protein [Gammaproteobacteria bacterium]
MKLVKYVLAVICASVAFQSLAADGIARANFTTAIENREPVDEVTELANDTTKIYYFTEIQGLEGQTITHRWEQNGEVQANVSFTVGGNRWRIWSSKNLQPEWTGEWQVMVVDEAGNVLSQNSFNYVAANTESTGETTAVTAEEAPTMETGEVAEEDLPNIAPAAGGDAEAPAAQ